MIAGINLTDVPASYGIGVAIIVLGIVVMFVAIRKLDTNHPASFDPQERRRLP